MKNIIFLLVFVIAAMAASAQTGKVKTITTDTVKGAETIYFDPIVVSGSYQSLSIQFLCTQLGGTTDGTIYVLASNDGTNYTLLNNVDEKLIFASPYARMNDSITAKLNLYNAATLNFVIKEPPHRYYKVGVTGTASDTTKLTGNYLFK